MDHLHERLTAVEQQLHSMNRRLRWWRGLACGVVVLAVLTWALPAVIAQEEKAKGKGPKGLAQRVAALEELLKHFSREKHEIFITGANLHIVNGLGRTGCGSEEEPIPDCPNGLGNLIVGYNESRAEFGDPGFEDIRTGSHNVVLGQFNNFSRFGGIVIGRFNMISGEFAAVTGGEFNTASGLLSSVSGGGQGNEASGTFAAVSGGSFNMASGEGSSVSGGGFNTASGNFSSVRGGGGDPFSEFGRFSGNTASGLLSSVSGGQGNEASGEGSSVSGGEVNMASGFVSSVSGGQGNRASGERSSSASGGRDNTASGLFAAVSGGAGNTASGEGAVVSGGQNITQEMDFGWSAGSEADEDVVGNFRSP